MPDNLIKPRWDGLCPAKVHGLDHEGQPCDRCAAGPTVPHRQPLAGWIDRGMSGWRLTIGAFKATIHLMRGYARVFINAAYGSGGAIVDPFTVESDDAVVARLATEDVLRVLAQGIARELTPPPAWIQDVSPRAFASLDAGGSQETMIHVYWSALGDARDAREGGHGHRMQRDKIGVSLGLDAAPEPGFTPVEMQEIAFAAKMAALKCLRGRRRRKAR